MDSLLLSCSGVNKNFGDRSVLKDIAFDMDHRERIGLVGRNGEGKSTLLKILIGQLEPDGGRIVKNRRDFSIGYLAQAEDGSFNIESIDSQNQNGKYGEVSSHLKIGYLRDRSAGDVVSGGERTKRELARIWASEPHLLILDEPTSSLDYQGVEWLITELRRYPGALLVVSHDRYFLDQTVTRILELEAGVIKEYSGNYSYYRDEKKRQYESQLHQYQAEEKTRKTIEANIEQQEQWAGQAHRQAAQKARELGWKKGGREYFRGKAKKREKAVKSKIKRLEKLKTEGAQKPRAETRIIFSFDEAGRTGRTFLEAKDIGKSFGDRILFQDSSFFIKRGEKVGLIGDNGTGKTTLQKIMLGEEVLDKGRIYVSSSARIACVCQDQSHLDQAKSALQYINEQGRLGDNAGTLLANLGLHRETLKQPMATLSPGEKTKLQIALAMMQDHNVLLLDEPGSYLDLFGREQLEESLTGYDGTILLIAHDRYMLEKICETLLVIKEQKIQRIEGGFREYMTRREQPHRTRNTSREQRMVLENRMSFLLGELGRLRPESHGYIEADRELREVMRKIRSLDS
ncbi:MAG: ribosomal protection-like ABC-F family protein [Ignavibacteriales bacterium]